MSTGGWNDCPNTHTDYIKIISCCQAATRFVNKGVFETNSVNKVETNSVNKTVGKRAKTVLLSTMRDRII